MVHVKLYGYVADIIGKGSIEIELPCTVAELRVRVNALAEGLQDLQYHVAVDQDLVGNDIELNEENEVAILPPFAGG